MCPKRQNKYDKNSVLVECVQEDLITIDKQLSDTESIWSTELVEDANYKNFSDSESSDEEEDTQTLINKFKDFDLSPLDYICMNVEEQTKINFLKIKKLTDFAKTPTRNTIFSAVYDLYSAESNIIKSNERNLISIDLIIEIPKNTYGRIASRSGLSLNYGIEVGA